MNNLFQIALFYAVGLAVYLLILKFHTAHRFKRVYLITVSIFGGLLPFLPTLKTQTVSFTLNELSLTPKILQSGISDMAPNTEGIMNLPIWTSIYLVGVVVFTLLAIRELIPLLFSKKLSSEGKINIYQSTNDSYYSFINRIFTPSTHADPVAIAHEKHHVELLHSLDIILCNLIFIATWPLPIIKWIQKELKLVHEFQVDEKCNQQFGLTTYLTAIEDHLFPKSTNLISPFANNHLKNRLIMMNKNKTSKKWPLVISMSILLAVGCGMNSEPEEQEESKTQISSYDGKIDGAVNYRKIATKPYFKEFTLADGETFTPKEKNLDEFSKVLDKMLMSNADRIAEANDGDSIGMVIVQVVIEPDGSSYSKILRGIGNPLDKEIEDILSELPEISPGKNEDGEPVTVTLTKPIRISG